MTTVRITPEIDANGDIFLTVLSEGSTDRVGPLQQEEELVAVLEPPVLSSGASPPTRRMKRLSLKQEARNAKLIGGQTQPGSGSSSRAKGDIRKLGEYRGESKFTFSKAFSLERSVLEKIMSECGVGEKPIVFLDYKNKETGRLYGSYVILHETDFEELVSKHAATDDPGSAQRKRR